MDRTWVEEPVVVVGRQQVDGELGVEEHARGAAEAVGDERDQAAGRAVAHEHDVVVAGDLLGDPVDVRAPTGGSAAPGAARSGTTTATPRSAAPARATANRPVRRAGWPRPGRTSASRHAVGVTRGQRVGVNSQGMRLMPWMKADCSISGSAVMRRSGSRSNSSLNITRISRRARLAPRQKCGPPPPYPKCAFGDRVMSKRVRIGELALVAVRRS